MALHEMMQSNLQQSKSKHRVHKVNFPEWVYFSERVSYALTGIQYCFTQDKMSGGRNPPWSYMVLIFSFCYPDWYPTTLGASSDGLASLMCVTSPIIEGRKGTANFSALEWNL